MVEVGFSSIIPCWLDTLSKEEFFEACLIHPARKQNKKNIFCLDCSMSFCINCSPTHFGHQVLQIRKVNDDGVVKVEDMEKLINCSKLQSYMLNRAQVVFLKARCPDTKKEKTKSQEQPNKEEGQTSKQRYLREHVCCSCPRSLKEEFDYCSLTCMVKKVLKTEGSILGLLRRFLHLPLNLEEADKLLVPGDLILRDPTTSGSMSKGTGRVDGLKRKRKNNEEASPCTFAKLHRRKGIPRRSPFH